MASNPLEKKLWEIQQKRAELDTYVICTTINDLLHSDKSDYFC